ncbi:TPA: peptidase T [Escherichia coli]|nr:peptidase T [Escherichia coli]EAN4728201.1 peptidase T [Salmonella enterica]EBV1256204.1 peptidase T [Salmonella enterica subsp. enterica serovar Corvallis]ECI5753006.1 peptidase T [Salmonella enterica subsp. enterica]EDL6138953.1 peptidase T [Salmonella enterica subsp. enterica serovar Typhimurium]EEV4884315.1 peptidase T [Salmonella enterica subsp. enterica serovar Durham]
MKKRIDLEQIVDTFLSYTKINTTSVEGSTQLPSCENQYKLAEYVVSQFTDIPGVSTNIKENAITTIHLPANNPHAPSIVFFAHLDTAPDHSTDTHAVRVKQYNGGIIPFAGSRETFSPEDNPELLNYIGQDILVTDGTSLLGADDKAAIAAGVEALKYMIKTPTFSHGDIRLVLLPDEETGIRGAKALDVSELNSDFGICLDCCEIGEYVVENWYAGSARITIRGVTAHPMSAKGKLINALYIATEIIAALPDKERPEYTEGREGYYWAHNLRGDTANATLDIAIRDFELTGYKQRKAVLQDIVNRINQRWSNERITLVLTDIYENVKPALDKTPAILDNVKKAMHNLDIIPKPLIMRGGYDGSVITPKGLPTINIFTGAHNFHSTREFLPVESLRLASEMLLEIVELSATEVKK